MHGQCHVMTLSHHLFVHSNINVFHLLPNYTACWQRCMYVNYLLLVICPMHQQHWTGYKISLCEWVSLSHKTSWTLYRSQSSTDLHKTCHQSRVPGDVVTYCFLVEIQNISIRQTGSGINPHRCSYGKVCLMSNISKTVRDTMLDSKDVR